MTKKIFAQPEIMVVRMNNNDIVTNSLQRGADVNSGYGDAPGLRTLDSSFDVWNEGF